MSGFIIVIEVDNIRARQAYQRGLDRLDAVLPELIQLAHLWDEKQDAINLEVIALHDSYIKSNDENYQKAMADWTEAKEAYAKYSQDLANYKSRGFLSSAQKPEFVAYPMPRPRSIDRWYMVGIKPERIKPQNTAVFMYENIRKALKEKLDLATLAIGPFRMTETDAQRMIAWEDGSKVDSLLEESKRYILKA